MPLEERPQTEWIRADDPFLRTFHSFQQNFFELRRPGLTARDKLLLGGLIGFFGLIFLFVAAVMLAVGLVTLPIELIRRMGRR